MNLLAVFNYLTEVFRGGRDKLFPKTGWEARAQVATQEIPIRNYEKKIHPEGSQTLDQFDLRRYSIFINRHTQNLTGQDPEQPDFNGLASSYSLDQTISRSPFLSLPFFSSRISSNLAATNSSFFLPFSSFRGEPNHPLHSDFQGNWGKGTFKELYEFQVSELSSQPGLISNEDVPQQGPQAHADNGFHAFVLWLPIYQETYVIV